MGSLATRQVISVRRVADESEERQVLGYKHEGRYWYSKYDCVCRPGGIGLRAVRL